ncbi:hypothetical protein N0B31_21920 (plasmid) [Salinirubellus salinus]|uniref:Uncharacterized protein n=1 Tax=Salinirubellus salinus TaxID=1364945 RepID=A0A9E7R9K8_9EURY|nr:hypothetical protein [Salinirubellus salinus]UWM57100.1 hypothetical protein N0B31_21920 [Salinirubellus salinus]
MTEDELAEAVSPLGRDSGSCRGLWREVVDDLLVISVSVTMAE